MPSFSIPLTGLESDNTALNTIANNLANMSTTGFKSESTEFANLLYQQFGQTGSGNAIQVGTGVAVADTTTNFSNGPNSNTQSTADMAINGNGFFVVSNGGNQLLTRAGNFSLSQTGQLLTPGGAQVMGYPAVNGVVNAAGALTGITLPIGGTEAPSATTSLALTANLDASASTGTPVPMTATIYDSLGTAHTVTINFNKTGANTWSYSASLESGASTGASGNTGTLTFSASGVPTVSSISGITFTGMADGATSMNFTLNTSSITQDTGASTVTNQVQNGYKAGQYQGFTVDASGTVYAQYNNGQSPAVGQLAIASVANVQGLSAVGGNLYSVSTGSGQAVLGVAGNGGRGTIEDSVLEGSNVDISTEFSNLIVAQRAFEANSKAVTTFDTVTQQAINMIH